MSRCVQPSDSPVAAAATQFLAGLPRYQKFPVLMTSRHLNGMQIACVLIDEVHLLSENRGAALEAGAICRIKMVSKYHDLHQVQSPGPCAV